MQTKGEGFYQDVGHVTGRLWAYAPDFVKDWDLQGLNYVISHFDRSSDFWQAVTWLTEKPAGIVIFYCLILAVGTFLLSRQQRVRWQSVAGILVCAVLLLGISEVLCNIILKPAFGKMKPGTVNYVVGSDPPLSFPSSHAFNTAFFFALLGGALKKLRYQHWAVIGVAGGVLSACVAFSRLVLQVHYPTDVLAGLLLGATAGYAFSPVWVKVWSKLQARPKS